jgi:pimeloyl-ACP methyl ester carboxylesterase
MATARASYAASRGFRRLDSADQGRYAARALSEVVIMMRSARWGSSLAIVSIVATAGCGSEERIEPLGAGDGGHGGAGGAGGGGSIAWTPCPAMTGGDGGGAECAEVALPVDWRDPEGTTLTVFVKRVVGTASARRQLWLLSGGPGGSGALFDAMAQQMAAADPTLEIYLPDHRGVGRSTRLGCPQESPLDHSIPPGAWTDCIASLQAEWGAALGAFNITNAAKDLGALIERTRAAGQDAHVFGVSYGTLWAQRYLQVFPEQPTSVTLDSMCQTGLCSFFQFDAWHDNVGRKLIDACAADAFCAGKMGADPLVTLDTFLSGLDAGACPELAALGLSRPVARQVFAVLLQIFDLRVLVPALAYRGNRCAPGDVAAFEHLAQLIFARPGRPDPASLLDSMALGMNIGLSEMVEVDPPSLADLQAFEDSAYFSFGYGTFARSLYDTWPRYPRDAYAGKYAPAEAPMLMLNGTLDPQTPIDFALEIAPNYTQPHQTFVAIDRAVHGTVFASPTVTPPHTPCGRSLWLAFLAGVTAPVDASCASDTAPIAFEGDPALAQAVLGTADLWENTMPAHEGVSDLRARRAVDELRWALQRVRRGMPLFGSQ